MKKSFVSIFCIVLIALLLVFFKVFKAEPTVFGLIDNMELLLDLQNDVIEDMNRYVASDLLPDDLKTMVEKYVNRSQEENSSAMKNVKLFLANPVNCYILIKRLTHDLDFVEDILEKYTDYGRNESSYPKMIFKITMSKIALVIFVYDIKAKEFSDGVFARNHRRNGDTFTANGLPMTPSDCYELALKFFQSKKHKIAHDWFAETLRKYEKECREGGCLVTESDILEAMEDNRLQSLLIYPTIDDQMNRIMQESEISHEDLIFFKENADLSTRWPSTMHHVCQTEQIARNRLRCQYLNGPHPFLRLARFKTELISLEPEIILFHNAISDEEIETIKRFPNKQQFKIEDITADLDSAIHRHVLYIEDKKLRAAAIISRRSLDISGLTDTMAERVKVVKYGSAGFHQPHLDVAATINKFTRRFSYNLGSLATVIYYLSEPDLGGATAFPKINVSVFPVKNSALYWSTLDLNNKMDADTEHGSCPVLHGSKWIIAKWLSPPNVLENINRDIFNITIQFSPLNYETHKNL